MRELTQDAIAISILAGAFFLIVGIPVGVGYSFYWVSITYSIPVAIGGMLGLGIVLIITALTIVKIDRRL